MSSYFKSKKFNKEVHCYKTKEYTDELLGNISDEYICVNNLCENFQKDINYKNINSKLNSYKKFILKEFIEESRFEPHNAKKLNELYKQFIDSEYILINDLYDFFSEFKNNENVQILTTEIVKFLDIDPLLLNYEKYRQVLINKIVKKFKKYDPIVKYTSDEISGHIDIFFKKKNAAIYIDDVSQQQFIKKLMDNRTKIGCKTLIFSSINKQSITEVLNTIEISISV